jgi:hypothetical protein
MGPEGSLPRLQEPDTCLYPEPDQSSYVLKILSDITLLSAPGSLFPVVSLPQVFPPKSYMHLSDIVLHAPPISFGLIWEHLVNIW